MPAASPKGPLTCGDNGVARCAFPPPRHRHGVLTRKGPYCMKRTLLTAAVAVTATLLSTVSVSGIARTSADAATATWDLNAYGPQPSDNVVLKWNQQLLDTITANAPKTGPTITSRALGVVQTAVYDAWAAYDGVAKRTQPSAVQRQPAAARTLENKSKAISYAAY